MTLLSNMLREDEGFEHKRVIFNTIISTVEEKSAVKEASLSQRPSLSLQSSPSLFSIWIWPICVNLSETVVSLATGFLYVLSREGPQMATLVKNIR
jgi:hypothetical protein